MWVIDGGDWPSGAVEASLFGDPPGIISFTWFLCSAQLFPRVLLEQAQGKKESDTLNLKIFKDSLLFVVYSSVIVNLVFFFLFIVCISLFG